MGGVILSLNDASMMSAGGSASISRRNSFTSAAPA
jgi:hypothetical protein